MEELSYEELRRIQGRERASPVLQNLPVDFYKAVKKLVEKKSEELKKNFSLIEAREYESIVKVAEDIHERRKQKVVMRAMKPGVEQDEVSLAEEERELFEQIRKAVVEEADNFNRMIQGKEGKVAEESIKRIKILKNLPKFVGVDLKVYGPFKAEDVASLPCENAESLIKRGIAVKVDIE